METVKKADTSEKGVTVEEVPTPIVEDNVGEDESLNKVTTPIADGKEQLMETTREENTIEKLAPTQIVEEVPTLIVEDIEPLMATVIKETSGKKEVPTQVIEVLDVILTKTNPVEIDRIRYKKEVTPITVDPVDSATELKTTPEKEITLNTNEIEVINTSKITETFIQSENGKTLEEVENNYESRDVTVSEAAQLEETVDLTEEINIQYNCDNITLLATTGNLFPTDHYLIGSKWSPDGSCLLTKCVDNKFRIFDLPKPVYSMQEWDKENDVFELKPSLTMTAGGNTYDYDWYPLMNSWSPPTCCFAVAGMNVPVHIFDAFTGKLRASYKELYGVEEVASCYCVKFGLSGDKIFCGYNNFIKIFDTACPGTQCTILNVKSLNDQRGIMSCIAENPTLSSLFAVGSYRKTIGLYTQGGDALCLLKGHRGGITNLMFSPDGTKLFSGSRMDNQILCWDMRNPGTVLNVLKRTVRTNQRIYFDITSDGRYLMTGGTDGIVTFYDINQLDSENEVTNVCNFTPHNDCTNGVSFNRKYPLIATSSGKLHFNDIISDEEDENIFYKTKNTNLIENTVKMWWMGDLTSNSGKNKI